MAYYISPKCDFCISGIYEFEKNVTFNKETTLDINIFAVSRYILYINDEYICEGPCRSGEDVRYYDNVNVKFNAGENKIKVKVMHLTDKKYFATVFKELKPVLLFEGENIFSDESWKISFIKNHKLTHPDGYLSFLPVCEEVYGNEEKEAFETEKVGEFNFKKGFYAPWGVIDNYNLQKRPIPLIYPTDEITFKTVKQGENFIELDAGEYTTAKVKVKADKNSNVKIIYSECYSFGERIKRKRDDITGEIKGMADILHSDDNELQFETYHFKAFRFIRIEFDKPIISITARKFHYPLNIVSSFECSDDSFNKMQHISINTMLSCMSDIIVDCPHYEQQQYVMDFSIEANVAMRMSNDLRLIKKCIFDFAQSQKSNGLIWANYPADYTQIIPGFSLFWIFLLKDYLDYTKDIDFVSSYAGTIDKLLSYFDNEIKKYGFISKSCYWDFVEWSAVWKEGEPEISENEVMTIYNLYYLYALKCAAYIAELSGRKYLSKDYMERYRVLKDTINELCYDKKRGMYRDSSNNKGTYSMHTIIWAVLSEIVSGKRAKKMINHLDDEDLVKTSSSMNYYLFRALEKVNCYDKAFEYFDSWKQMIDLNCTTWCENLGVGRSECHGWSSAPLYEFSSNILGVKVSYENEIIIKPHFFDFTYAKGTVPTRFGNVNVEVGS